MNANERQAREDAEHAEFLAGLFPPETCDRTVVPCGKCADCQEGGL